MKKAPGLSLLFGAAGLLLFSSPERKVDEILARLGKKYNATETVSCRFTQLKKISQLEGVVRLAGRLYFKRPHFIRLELRGEENLIIYCDGKTIWLEDLDLNEVEEFDFSELGANERLSRFLPPVFGADFAELKQAFTIRMMAKEGRGERLELVPRPGTGFSFQYLRFDVDAWSRIPWMKIVYANEDYTEMQFRDWRSQPEISDHFFKYLKSPKKPGGPGRLGGALLSSPGFFLRMIRKSAQIA